MDYLRRLIRDFFGFSGREINGFLILLPLMFILISTEPVYHWYVSQRVTDYTHENRILDSLVVLLNEGEKKSAEMKDSLFVFDPNKSSAQELMLLGFTNNLSTRITSYRNKGGSFKVKSDLLKIYGVDSSLYTKLFPFILLPEKRIWKVETQHQKPSTQRQKDQLARFDINQADTTQLKSVYGIGTKLAGRIIKFRDILGGFVKMAQLHEVFGLDSATVQQVMKKSFITADFTPRKINLNTANERELSAHPYIRYQRAKTIAAWRFQHGKFEQVQDLEKVSLITPDDIRKLLPYLKTND
jgi:competence protein ComEA